MTSPTSSPPLPVELWLQIFRWATLDPWSHALYTAEYHPFEALDANVKDAGIARSTKTALVRVCKEWRRWTIPLLYEDILIPRAYPLFSRLLRYGEDFHDGTIIPPCARMVKRAHLPYSSTITTSPNSLQALGVLKLCSSLEVLVRTAEAFEPNEYDFTTDCPPFPSLKRLDWWHDNEAARSGGINSLEDVLFASPNLEYLSVGGELWPSYLNAAQVHLPHLNTLRLRRMNAYFVLKLCRWSMPALEHLIFDNITNAEMFWSLWAAFGRQVRTVELGVSLRFYVQDFLTHVFEGCPQLEEVNYYVHFTHYPPVDRPQESLHTIGLHAHPNSFFDVGSPDFWTDVESHFSALSQSAFPALKRVLLYGDWKGIVEDGKFERIAQPLREKGCSIERAYYD